MNRNQFDKYSSLRKSEAHLRANASALAGLPRVVAKAAELSQHIQRIGKLVGDADQDSRGYAIDKKLKRDTLVATLLRLARNAHVHYVATADADMEALVAAIKARTLSRLRDADLYLFAQKTHEALLPDAPAMPGSAPADIVLLASQITDYYQAIHAPRILRQQRSAAVAGIIVAMRDAEAVCQEIEIYMRTLIDSNEMLYLLWRSSRNIDRTGVRQKKKKE